MALYPFASPADLPPRRGAGAWADDCGAEAPAAPPAADLSRSADHQHRRTRLPIAGRVGGRLRQGRRGRRRHARPRLRLRRGRHAHAAAAVGQSAAAPVPADRGPRRHQPPRLQQSRPGRRFGAAGQARPQPRHRRGQYRRQQGQSRPHRRLCRGCRGPCPPVADYLTINISSPNTPGLRQLQDEGALRSLLSAVGEARTVGGPPIFLKVAPDLGEGEPDQIVRVALAARHRRPDRRQHHDLPPAPPVAPRGGNRRPVRRAAQSPGPRRSAPLPRGERRRDSADRRRRHRLRPTTPGRASAPAPASSSSIRR